LRIKEEETFVTLQENDDDDDDGDDDEYVLNISREVARFIKNLTVITCNLHADRYTFLIISRSVLLRMRNIPDKSCTQSQNTHFVFSNVF